MMPLGKSWLMLAGGPLQGVLIGMLLGWLLHMSKGAFALTWALGFFAGVPLGLLEWNLISHFEENKPRRRKKR